MVVSKNFVTHLALMMSREGETVTKRRVSPITSTNGRITDVTNTDTSITAIIGMIPVDSNLTGIGWLQKDDLVGLFNYSDDVKEHDIIIKDSQEFEVIRTVLLEDGSIPLGVTGYLRRRAD